MVITRAAGHPGPGGSGPVRRCPPGLWLVANAHPHWDWLDRLSPYWGNPLCAAYTVAWCGGLGSWLHIQLGFYPGDQFYRSRWVPRSRRDRDADIPERRGPPCRA